MKEPATSAHNNASASSVHRLKTRSKVSHLPAGRQGTERDLSSKREPIIPDSYRDCRSLKLHRI